MKKVLIALFLLFTITSSTAFGFDGERRGFVLGGGLGVAAVSKWSVDVDILDIGILDYEEEQAAVAAQIIIGGAFDKRNMLVFEINLSGYESTDLDLKIGQFYYGAAWYHYFGETGNSFFTALGIGLFSISIGDHFETSPGGAILLGAGYEFTKHVQAGVYLSGGKSNKYELGLDGDFEHTQLSFIISALAY